MRSRLSFVVVVFYALSLCACDGTAPGNDPYQLRAYADASIEGTQAALQQAAVQLTQTQSDRDGRMTETASYNSAVGTETARVYDNKVAMVQAAQLDEACTATADQLVIQKTASYSNAQDTMTVANIRMEEISAQATIEARQRQSRANMYPVLWFVIIVAGIPSVFIIVWNVVKLILTLINRSKSILNTRDGTFRITVIAGREYWEPVKQIGPGESHPTTIDWRNVDEIESAPVVNISPGREYKDDGLVDDSPTTDRRLVAQVIEETLGHPDYGPGSEVIPSYDVLGMSSRGWQRATNILQDAGCVDKTVGRGGGTDLTDKYTDVYCLWDALRRGRIPLPH